MADSKLRQLVLSDTYLKVFNKHVTEIFFLDFSQKKV